MTQLSCHVCTGRLAHVEHGVPCSICGRKTCGNCYKAIGVPHVAAGHSSGVAVCMECLRTPEASSHVLTLRSHFKQYMRGVQQTLDLWKFHAAEEREGTGRVAINGQRPHVSERDDTERR